MSDLPVLWSFRRCPYAMRARLAIRSSGVPVELREILLKEKPPQFLATSPSATVPSLRTATGVIDESLDIMIWALKQNDPEGLLNMPDDGWKLIERNDGPFKTALDHTKYSVRFPDLDLETERAKAKVILFDLETRLNGRNWLFGEMATLCDFAVLPFIRQFANIDPAWFSVQPWPNLQNWLNSFTQSPRFQYIMEKHTPWHPNQPPKSL